MNATTYGLDIAKWGVPDVLVEGKTRNWRLSKQELIELLGQRIAGRGLGSLRECALVVTQNQGAGP